MDISIILELVKDAKLIRSSTSRDSFITAIINSVISELKDEKGIALDSANDTHIMFVVDLTIWRYDNPGSPIAIPRHLQFRLHNLMTHNKAVRA